MGENIGRLKHKHHTAVFPETSKRKERYSSVYCIFININSINTDYNDS